MIRGMILDGENIVGFFESSLFKGPKIRILHNVKLKNEYVNLSSNQTNKQLKFILVEERGSFQNQNIAECIENYGYGFLTQYTSSVWCDESNAIFKDAFFLESKGSDEN